MRMVDTAAGLAAARHCHGRVVTAAIDEMSFLAPAHVGDLLTIYAMVNDANRTSMEVGVRVEVEQIPSGEVRHVSSAHLIFVALGEDGRPTAVPPVIAVSEDEKRRQEHARIRREQRLLRRRSIDRVQ